MKLLSRSEEVILLSVFRLGGNAYGVTIREQASESTGREWTLGAVYVPLDTLTRKELVRKSIGKPSAERGGRRKCFYTLTGKGRAALKEIRRVQDSLWDGISEYAFD